jgi:hypothetical protein
MTFGLLVFQNANAGNNLSTSENPHNDRENKKEGQIMKTKNLQIYLLGIVLMVWVAGCGGGGGQGDGGVQPATVAADDNLDTSQSAERALTGATGAANATGVASLPNDKNYKNIEIPPRQRARRAASLPTGTYELTLTPSTQGMGIQGSCAADYSGHDGSVTTGAIWLAMAYNTCWSYDGLLQFDITPAAGITTPNNIVYVELQLYMYTSYGQQGAAWLYDFQAGAYANTGPWDEASTWFYSLPAYDTTTNDNRIVITKDLGWKVWDVTDIMVRWQTGAIPNYGLRLHTFPSRAPRDSNAFFYDETSGAAQSPSLSPRLVIYYKLDSDMDTVPDETDACPTVSALGLDADLNGCIDTTTGLSDLSTTLNLPGPTMSYITEDVRQALDAHRRGNFNDSIKWHLLMYRNIERDKGRNIPNAKADLLMRFLDNIIKPMTTYHRP